jgi:hypothetical protein
LRPLEAALRNELRPDLRVVGQTYDSLAEAGVLRDCAGLHRLPARREGGLIHLVGDVVSDDPRRRLDAVIYLLNPDDPTSVFPKARCSSANA